MIKLIKKNLYTLFKNNMNIAILLVFIQFISVIIIYSSYGIVNHYNTKVNEIEGVSLLYSLNLDEAGKKEVNEFFSNVLPVINKKLDYFYINAYLEEYNVQVSSGYRNGIFRDSVYITQRMNVIKGDIFSSDDMNSGEKVAMIKPMLDDGTGIVLINDIEYRVIGVYDDEWEDKGLYVPYRVFPDGAKTSSLLIVLTKPLLESEYNYIKETAIKVFDSVKKITNFEGVYNESDNRVYRNIMLITILLTCTCVINYCIVYKCILERRKKYYAVCRICGASKKYLGIAYLIELIFVSMSVFIITTLLYNVVLLPKFSDIFEYMAHYYNFDIYIKMFIMYFIILFISYTLFILSYMRKTPVLLAKEG